MPAPVMPEWLALLHEQVAKGKSVSALAREIDMPRGSLSSLLNGSYQASLDRVTARYAPIVVARYRSEVFCPHLQRGISGQMCRTHALAPLSVSDPDRLRQHTACRRCALNPVKPSNGKDHHDG